MTEFRSNQEFMGAVKALIDQWCSERRIVLLAIILPKYLAFNGLTDGWAELRSALHSLRGQGPDSFTPSEWLVIADLIRGADKALRDRSFSN